MTSIEDIIKAAQSVAEEREKRRHRSFFETSSVGGVRKQVIMECLKWLFFCSGVVGILTYGQGGLTGIFTHAIVGNLTFATVVFPGALVGGCVLASLQKSVEVTSRVRADEASSLVSGLATDLGKGPKTVYVGDKVLSELDEIKKILSARQPGKKRQMDLGLQKNGEISILRRKIGELTKEKESLREKLKQVQQEYLVD